MSTTQDLANLTDDYIVKRLWRVSSIERARVQVDTLRMMTDAYKCDMIDVLMSPKDCVEMLTEMWEPALPKEAVIDYVKQLTHVVSFVVLAPDNAKTFGPILRVWRTHLRDLMLQNGEKPKVNTDKWAPYPPGEASLRATVPGMCSNCGLAEYVEKCAGKCRRCRVCVPPAKAPAVKLAPSCAPSRTLDSTGSTVRRLGE